MNINPINSYHEKKPAFKGIDIKLAKNSVKHPIKVLFSDVDGTIIDNTCNLPYENISAIKRLIDSGVKIILTTGRGHKTIDFLFEKFHMKPDYAITECGAAIIDPNKNKIYENVLSLENVRKIIEIAKQLEASNQFLRLIFDGLAYVEGNAGLNADKQNKTGELRVHTGVVSSFNEFLDKGILPTKAVFAKYDSKSFEDIENLETKLKEKLGSDLNIINTGYNYCEVMNPNVSKATAIEVLKKCLNYKYENIASIGDAENDICMSKLLTSNQGLSISMGNAASKMKLFSRFITDTVENLGFAKAINTIIEINNNLQSKAGG